MAPHPELDVYDAIDYVGQLRTPGWRRYTQFWVLISIPLDHELIMEVGCLAGCPKQKGLLAAWQL